MRRRVPRPAILIVALIAAGAGFIAGLLHAGRSAGEVVAMLGFDAQKAEAEEAPAPPEVECAAAAPGSANILLVGDVLPVVDREYLTDVRRLVSSADIAVCNLECPISTHGRRTPLKLTDAGSAMHNEYFFRAPPSQARRLADAGFDGVTLANNHSMDFGGEALLETLNLLDKAGLRHTGAGADRRAARRPMTFSVEGQTVAVLAYCDRATLPGIDHFKATDETAGAVFVRCDASGRPDEASLNVLRNDIAGARERANFVIVSFHWGVEGTDDPSPSQRRLAHRAIDAGADAIIGHHPHKLQGVEIYRGKPIAYSLGNFAFPTPWESNHFSAALELRVKDGNWTSLVFHPVRLEHRVGDPAPAGGDDAERIIKRLKGLSEALGTDCTVIDIESPRVRVAPPAPSAEDAPVDADPFDIEPHPELDGMTTVRFLAWDLESGAKITRQREVVVNEALADDVLTIFREIYEADERFPIHEVIGYDYRTVAGGSGDRLSWHAVGRAIDINRAENPMIEGGKKIVHPDEPPYEPGEWRPDEDPYSIPANGSVVEAFTRRGWRWGGTWTSCKDYQHFDRPG